MFTLTIKVRADDTIIKITHKSLEVLQKHFKEWRFGRYLAHDFITNDAENLFATWASLPKDKDKAKWHVDNVYELMPTLEKPYWGDDTEPFDDGIYATIRDNETPLKEVSPMTELERNAFVQEQKHSLIDKKLELERDLAESRRVLGSMEGGLTEIEKDEARQMAMNTTMQKYYQKTIDDFAMKELRDRGLDYADYEGMTSAQILDSLPDDEVRG